MKHIFILFLSFVAFPALAVTSKSYVDSAVAPLQNEIPAVNTDTVLINTGVAGEISTKKIYNSTQSFGTQTDALVTAETFNAAVQNAIDNEFVCIESIPEGCLLYQIRPVTPKQTFPTGYTRLEYIESTGTQHIDTGISPSQNTGMSIKYAFTQFLPATYLFGSFTPHFYLGINSLGTGMVMSYGAGSGNVVLLVPVANISTNTIYTANMNMYNSHMVEFVGLAGPNQLAEKSFYNKSTHIWLFSVSGTYRAYGRIYSVQITDGANLVRDFIPARRNSDNVLGMYDMVSDTFFTNAGTGTFIAGPDVNSNLYLPSGN